MKIADLYIRVSTDEQADKGYSQRDQEERLLRYCESNLITVRRIIFEDHSAKTFIRPEWEKFISVLKQQKNRTNLVLFTKWDRFSRNAPDAYNMIAILRKLGVEPQAIEQPLDLNVPENKMMLAIYLTAPEIENDRRGLNTFYGLRRARKEGRWPGLAPVGYVNKTAEDGRKFIAPDGKQAELMKWSFVEISKGTFSTEQIYKRAVVLGLLCSKNNFLRLIRNPIYVGNIPIPKYKDEESFVVKGIHEPLISVSLFEQVQDILDGKVRSIKTKIIVDDQIPLRGFLLCSKCTRALCGSASKGRNNYYYYYHCSSKCGCRYKAEEINDEMVDFLREFNLNKAVTELLKIAILEEYANNTVSFKEKRSSLANQITSHQNKLTKARELLLMGDIDGEDYRIMKAESQKFITIAEEQLNDLSSKTYSVERLEPIIDKAMNTLSLLDVIYCKSSGEEKRKLIGSMFPEKTTFENLKHRTAKIAEPYSYIYQINSTLTTKKTGQKTLKSLLPREG